MKPTLDFYGYLQSAFEFFNNRLFDDKLPDVMFTITRKKNTCGYFKENGWVSEDGTKTHEIAINPQYFITTSPLELSQTIVHECHHLNQALYGTPSRRNYHNKEWADNMRATGLIPISKNGKGTGQSVSDEPEPGGLFEKACADFFLAGYRLAIVDSRFSSEKNLQLLNATLAERLKLNVCLNNDIEVGSEEYQDAMVSISQPMNELYEIEIPDNPTQSYSVKTKYKCPNCEFNVWGTFGLPVGCMDCNTSLVVVR